MSETSSYENSSMDSAAIGEESPPADQLPPVEPPSAGFIVQLFLIPSIIVIVIVGVWALFGQLASNEEDITRVLVDIRSSNSNRRGPAMLTFTRILQADSHRERAEQKYVNNSSVASSAADTLEFWLKNVPSGEKEKVAALNTQIFLTRALGLFDLPDVVLPVLRKALHVQPEPFSGDDTEQEIRNLQQQVRTSAVVSIAIIADRSAARGTPIHQQDLINELIEVTNSPDAEAELRHRGAFALGLLPSEQSRQQLSAWLQNADDKTRLNSAIGLARQGSLKGYDVFVSLLRDAAIPIDPKDVEGATAPERKKNANRLKFERWVAVKNVLEAVRRLSDRLDDSQRRELINLIEPIAREFKIRATRKAAQTVLETLKGS